MESATLQRGRPGSNKAARRFRAASYKALIAAASFANEDRQSRARSSARSKAQICQANAVNKNTAAADGGLSHRIEQQTRALELHRKNEAETEPRRPPKEERRIKNQSTATSQTRRLGGDAELLRPIAAAHRP